MIGFGGTDLRQAALGLAPVAAGNYALSNAAGPEVSTIAAGLNVVIEWLKNRPWFHEKTWTIPVLILLSFGVSFGLWYLLGKPDLGKAVVNSFGILSSAHLNYQGIKASGVPLLAPTPAANRWQPPMGPTANPPPAPYMDGGKG